MNQSKYIIIACERGNPRDPKSWSGTPSNLVQAFERQGYSVFGIDSTIKNRYQRLLYRLIHIFSGLGSHDYLRGRMARTHRARIVETQSKALESTKILHMGSLDAPITKFDPTFEHYYFCDATWNLWSKQVPANTQRYTPKMLQLAEELERETYAQFKHFFPISKYVYNDLVNHYKIDPKRITIVGTGRGAIEPFTGEKDYSNGHILFVVKSSSSNAKSRFEEKGGFLLLEGFKIAQAKNPNIKLVIVGNEEYNNLIGNIPNVTVTGYIPWEKLQNLFYNSALFAMPAANEVWGLVYLEALACKTPILGLNRNALPEITQYGKYGFLVNKPTPDSIADAILKAFSDPQKLREMGIMGQKYCLDTFSWDFVVNKIAQVMLQT
jgi:glycosyltransferase involved in cell wall biosynthesis